MIFELLAKFTRFFLYFYAHVHFATMISKKLHKKKLSSKEKNCLNFMMNSIFFSELARFANVLNGSSREGAFVCVCVRRIHVE